MHEVRWLRTITACVVLLVITSISFAGSANARASVRPQISRPSAVAAPVGAKGGVISPYVVCSRHTVEPRVRWKLTRLASGKSRTYRWRGALPGMRFPRVAAGAYRSTTTAWCRGNKVSRTHQVRVARKTFEKTISRAEFDAVRRGMTRSQVRNVVGFHGRDCHTFARKTSCVFDMMPFWLWSIITFRDGRVVAKYWNVAHD